MKQHAFPAECPRCGAATITTQWDFAELMPYLNPVRADPTSITPDTETACIILDRPTYGHYTRGHQTQLVPRDAHWHRWHHHGVPEHILPAHRCGTTLPGTPLDLPPETDAAGTPNDQLDLTPEIPCPY